MCKKKKATERERERARERTNRRECAGTLLRFGIVVGGCGGLVKGAALD
jgi:hypothetical protein